MAEPREGLIAAADPQPIAGGIESDDIERFRPRSAASDPLALADGIAMQTAVLADDLPLERDHRSRTGKRREKALDEIRIGPRRHETEILAFAVFCGNGQPVPTGVGNHLPPFEKGAQGKENAGQLELR